ncbi:MAG: hypothetical protein IPH05_18605 [Flavobacteriales bacterium]|nr:hypothetical protein [Flavobacteriales bacterium]
MVDGPALVFIPMELKPPIACRTTDELLRITADPTNWTPEARALARIEHEHRAIPASAIAARELAYAEKERGQAELLARNASESYSAWQIIGLFLVAPILIIGKLLGNHFALDIKLDRTELRSRELQAEVPTTDGRADRGQLVLDRACHGPEPEPGH